MKALLASTLVIVGVAVFSVAYAQQSDIPQQPYYGMMYGTMGQNHGMMGQGYASMMGQGMMGGMMGTGNIGTPDTYLSLTDDLELTDSQVRQLKDLRLNFVKNTSDNRSELQVTSLELQDLLNTDNVNIRDVEKKVREIHTLQADFQIEAVRTDLEARDVLTQAQRGKAQDLLHFQGAGSEYSPGIAPHMYQGMGRHGMMMH